MKKALSFLLCLVLMLSLLASCNNDEGTTSSEISELSETSEVYQEPQIPEKVVYFTGEYENFDFEYREMMFDKLHLRELGGGSLDEYISTETPSDDTYFLVRVSYTDGSWNPDANEIEAMSSARKSTLDFLKNYDYIDIENHPWISTGEFMKEINDCSDTEEQNLLVLEQLKKMFSDIEPALIETACENGDFEIVAYMGFPAIGYISAGALKDIAELTLPDTHSLTLTWFPAPDDQERWLTFDYDYREQQETSDKIK